MTDSVIVEHKGQMNESSVSLYFFSLMILHFTLIILIFYCSTPLRDNMRMD